MSGGRGAGARGCAGPCLCCVSVTPLSLRYITCAEYTQFYGGKKAGKGGTGPSLRSPGQRVLSADPRAAA